MPNLISNFDLWLTYHHYFLVSSRTSSLTQFYVNFIKYVSNLKSKRYLKSSAHEIYSKANNARKSKWKDWVSEFSSSDSDTINFESLKLDLHIFPKWWPKMTLYIVCLQYMVLLAFSTWYYWIGKLLSFYDLSMSEDYWSLIIDFLALYRKLKWKVRSICGRSWEQMRSENGDDTWKPGQLLVGRQGERRSY